MASTSSSLFDDLLQQHDQIRQQIDSRLLRVEEELRRLDAIREGLSEPRQESASARRTVVIPASSPDRKRPREGSPSPPVAFLKTHRVQHRASANYAADPFEAAGLYAKEGNACALLAPVQLSRDEALRQELLTLFPEYAPSGTRKSAALPPAAVSRIEERMRAADIDKGSGYVLDPCSKSGAHLRVVAPPDIRHVKHLMSASVVSTQVERLRSTLCSDPGAIRSHLYAAIAESAVAQALTVLERASVVHLLGLEHLARSSAETVEWTFKQCCQCDDRDVMESTLVQWVHTLRSACPRRRPASPQPQSVLYAAVCYALLQKLAAAASVRQGYLAYVLTACGGYERLIDIRSLAAARSFDARNANVSTVFEKDFQLLRSTAAAE